MINEEQIGLENQDLTEEILQTVENNTESSPEMEDDEQANEVSKLKIELAEARDKYVRLFAEFDNFKKRTMKERLELIKTASQETLTSLLPVLDDFDRAKKASESGNSDFPEGIKLIHNKLIQTLENKGLKPMESTGESFDAENHEAITEIPAPSPELSGKVIDTVEKGYYLGDKIIRYAKVVVGK